MDGTGCEKPSEKRAMPRRRFEPLLFKVQVLFPIPRVTTKLLRNSFCRALSCTVSWAMMKRSSMP
jgi:hypothetical protein